MEKLVLTPKEAAEILAVSYKTVLKLAKTEGFPAVKVGEKNIRIPAEALRDWVKRKAAEPLD